MALGTGRRDPQRFLLRQLASGNSLAARLQVELRHGADAAEALEPSAKTIRDWSVKADHLGGTNRRQVEPRMVRPDN